MAGKKVGVYFGRETISIVEAKGRQVLSQVNLSLPGLEAVKNQIKDQQGQAEDASAGAQVQCVAMIRGALRDNKVEGKRAFVGLANKDLFIRSFQMPILSKSEIDLAVQFEVKKYIPFKTEDLVFNYQRRIDKKAGKMDILFAGATKSGLDNYLFSLNEAGLQAQAIEPAALSLLRILALAKHLNPRSSFALVAMQGQEAEFAIVDKGFLCFSRDMNLSQPAAVLISDTTQSAEISCRERLVSEIRVSLDYFRRQFSSIQIEKLLFLSKNLPTEAELIAGLGEDLGLAVERVELEKEMYAYELQDLNTLKAYALALKDTVKIALAVDLAKRKFVRPAVVPQEGEEAAPEAAEEEKPLVLNIFLIRWAVALAVLFIGFAFGYPLIDMHRLNARLNAARAKAYEAVPGGLKGLALEALKQKKTTYAQRIAVLEKLVNSRLNIIPSLNSIPAAVDKGLWLEEVILSSKEEGNALLIKGAVYLEDEVAASEAVSAFYRKLKNSPDFMRGLKDLELKSVSRKETQVDNATYTLTCFEISGGP